MVNFVGRGPTQVEMLFDADKSPKQLSPKLTTPVSENQKLRNSQAIIIRERDSIPPTSVLQKPTNLDLSKSYFNTSPRRKDEVITDKVGSSPLASPHNTPRTPVGKIPGYSGHIPGVIVGGVPGKSFTTLTMLDPISVRVPPLWLTNYRETTSKVSSVPNSARAYLLPTSEDKERAATFRDHTLHEQQALHQKYFIKNKIAIDELRRDKLTSRSFTLPTVDSRIRPKADDSFVAAITRGKQGEQRAISPVGQPPDRDSSFWQLCCRYLESLDLDFDLFDPSLDKRYTRTNPPLMTVAGSAYEVPVGWVGFGLRVPAWCHERDIWSQWHTSFYPCPPQHLTTVLRTGAPVIPGDALLDGSRCKTVYLAQRGFVEKAHPNTPLRDRCATRLYTTPSARYAADKFLSLTRHEGLVFEGRRLCVVLQCKQMGGALNLGGYQVCGETIGRAEDAPPRSRISPYFDDSRLEFYTLRKASVVPYRLLFKPALPAGGGPPADESQPTGGPGDPEARGRAEPVDDGGPARPYTRDVKWQRVDHPAFASARSTAPGLDFPFFEFNDPAAVLETRRGGLEPPTPHAPYVTFPERRAVRRPARPHVQPAVAEWTVRPASGWLDGEPASPISPLTPGAAARGGGPRTVQGVLDGMRGRIGAVARSFSEVLSRLGAAAGGGGAGEISRGELARILVRLRLVASEEDPLFGEVWRHLSPGDGAAMPVRELDRRFGVTAETHDILISLRQRVRTDRPAPGTSLSARRAAPAGLPSATLAHSMRGAVSLPPYQMAGPPGRHAFPPPLPPPSRPRLLPPLLSSAPRDGRRMLVGVPAFS